MKNMSRKKILSKYILLSLLLLLAFIVFRYVLLRMYTYPFNLYCSDAITYLRLASDIKIAHPNRPSGYPAILSLILPYFYKNWNALFLLQSAASFCLLFLSLVILRKKISKTFIVVWSCLIFFNFHAVFMEKSIMSDSVSYNMLILGSLIIISGLNRWWKYILIGIISGLFPLLRTNYLIFSLLLICVSALHMFFSQQNIQKRLFYFGLLCIPFFLITSIYISTFVYPQLGIKQISSYGGRLLFSRVLEFTPCNNLRYVKNEPAFLTTLINLCDDTGRSSYMDTTFGDTGLIYKVNNELNLDRATSDSLYFKTSMQLIFRKPTIVFLILSESIQDMFRPDDSFYLGNRYPNELGCADFLDKFGIDSQVFSDNNALNFTSPSVIWFAFLAALSQKIIVVISYFLLPIWLIINTIRNKPRHFIHDYGEVFLIWLVAVIYFTLSIIFGGFDYRYPQPLWILLAWGLYTRIKPK